MGLLLLYTADEFRSVPLFMIFLLISFVVLFLAPAIDSVSQGNRSIQQMLQSFIFVVLVGIVFGDIVPHAFSSISWAALPIMLVGLSGPSLMERLFNKYADSTHQVTLVVAVCGLLLHAMIDGALFNDYGDVSGHTWLPVAVLLHRLPLAIMLFVLLRPMTGVKGAYMGLLAIGIFTSFGYVLGIQLEAFVTGQAFAIMQSLVAGTLLHVLVHQPHSHSHNRRHDDVPSKVSHQHATLKTQIRAWNVYHLIGVCVAVMLLVFLEFLHPH